jgi:membrane-associated phospholipid phosphatase
VARPGYQAVPGGLSIASEFDEKERIMPSIPRIATSLVFSVLSMTVVGAARADVVTDWNVVATTAAAAPFVGGVPQTRVDAMVHVAIHDALNAIDRRYHPYALDAHADPNASPEAAVATAAHDVLVHELPPIRRPIAEAAYTDALAGIPDGAAKDAGIAIGQAAAAAIIALRTADGSQAPMTYTPGSGPGVWIPTPPDFLPAAVPGWGNVTPFAMRSGAQFRLDRPDYFDLTSDAYTADYEEVKSIGETNSSVRTPEQSEIARFWYEPSVQGWNRIARIASGQQNFDLWESARLFALLNIALADAYIAHFDTKYLYNFWRPVTAIRAADTDGNDDTVPDPEWTSYLITPNIPDYPSGHATAGAAAATVLTRFVKHDALTFSSTSGAPFPGITRTFESFWAAAEENAASRVYAGIHFRTATVDGLRLGEQVGRFAFTHVLKPGK